MKTQTTKTWSDLTSKQRKLVVHKVTQGFEKGMSQECRMILCLLAISILFAVPGEDKATNEELATVFKAITGSICCTMLYERLKNKFDPIVTINTALENEMINCTAKHFIECAQGILEEITNEHFRQGE